MRSILLLLVCPSLVLAQESTPGLRHYYPVPPVRHGFLLGEMVIIHGGAWGVLARAVLLALSGNRPVSRTEFSGPG